MDQATLITPEQVRTFMFVAGALAFTNAGAIVKSAYNSFVTYKKMQRDLKAAHDKIRKLERHVYQIPEEEI